MNNTNTNTNTHKDPIPWPQPNHSKNTLPKTDGCNRSTCKNKCDDKAKNNANFNKENCYLVCNQKCTT